jgi:hypothetical protein
MRFLNLMVRLATKGPGAGALGAAALLAAGCGSTLTQIDYVETDTYISSADDGNHSELPQLRVSNTGGIEERGLLKLPTGARDPDRNIDQIFDNLSDPVTWPLAPFLIVADIFASFFNCTSTPLTSANLVSSYLVIDVADNSQGAALAGLTIQHLSKPWWQTVTWTRAFPFADSSGKWSSAGGDLDSTFMPITATVSGSTIQFDVTSYFKQLLDNSSLAHYGFALRSATSMPAVSFESVQFDTQSRRPRLVSTYNCVGTGSSLREAGGPKPYTFVLGPR